MANEPEVVTAKISLTIEETRLDVNLVMPTAPTRLSDVLPVLHSLSAAVIGAVVNSVETRGRTISCRKGCAACCYQLVPVPEAEARRIRDLVDHFPEPRRSEVRARFSETICRLDEAGLLDRLRDISSLSTELRPLAKITFTIALQLRL